MNVADAHGRRDEVAAAFLEGWRKKQGGFGFGMSDREAWLSSTAYARLAYGVFPPCPKCRCQIINPHVSPPTCMKCGEARISETTQTLARRVNMFEPQRVEQILRRPLERLGDGRDCFPDPKDYP